MEVWLKTTGGFAAGLRRPDRCVDTATLSPEARSKLDELVNRACGAAGPPERSVPDAMTYTIIVGTGTDATVLTACDGIMSPEFRTLLAWVRSNAR